MKCLIVLFAVAAVSSAQLIYSPLASHYAAPLAAPLAAYPAVRTQYHAQNELGQYSFGYSGGPSSKYESSSHGVTQGGFSYVDAHGLVQSRSYVADPVNGFRVAATDIPVDANTPVAHPVAPVAVIGRKKRSAVYTPLAYSPLAYSHPLSYTAHPVSYAAHPVAYAAHPVAYHSALPADTPEVAAAKVAHYNQYNHESIRNAILGRKKRSLYAYSAPLAPAVYHAAPLAPSVYHAAPLAYAPLAGVATQYHAQNGLGGYSYGYSHSTY